MLRCNKTTILLGQIRQKKQQLGRKRIGMDCIKPPIGLTPRFIRNLDRIQEIFKAIERYIEAKKDIPYKWVAELIELQRIESERTNID